ncbi:MAG: HlyD family efflux transporter periplasmic adaptor subunit, partial [bacterium]|nr:HlyD family efflux transporter periplasmic adaptor subunit [bacterium]
MRKTILLLPIALLWIGCAAAPENSPGIEQNVEPEPVVVTMWSDSTELFVEFPPLIAGETSRFAIHFTDLGNFQPLFEGRSVVELDYGSGTPVAFVADGPSRPGIFGVDVNPPRPGRARLSILVESGAVDDRHELGSFGVLAAGSEPPASTAEEGDEGITFLKEQQWSLDFGTAVVRGRPMRESLLVAATMQPRSGGRILVTAPITGRLLTSTRLPAFGTTVASGQMVASIVPPTSTPADRASLDLAMEEAQVELALAGTERERVERLLEAGAIPRRRVDEARASEEIAQARLKSARARIAQYEGSQRAQPSSEAAFSVRSPLAGVITELYTTDGAFVAQGENLVEIVATDTVYVVGDVPEAKAAAFRRPSAAMIEAPGMDRAIRVGRLVSVSRFIDPRTRTLKVIYEVDNSRSPLAVGQAVSLRLFAGGAAEVPAV